MKPETTTAIRSMTLAARELLFAEIDGQLEGIYGFLPDGKLKPADQYPILSAHAEAGGTRKLIEQFVEDEGHAGLSPLKAREKLQQEAAFTWLNRFAAFKMMETRKLVRQTVSKGQDSNGFKMWLTEPGNEDHYKDYEAGDLPLDGLGEGPRQRAYRRFLLARCEMKAREIRVLFDPENLSSRLCPRPPALKKLVETIGNETLLEAWQPGNEETIGWIYQFFIETKKKDVFDRLYKKKEKVRAEDIPAATQIFTPRWVVRFLVENTLGRMWVQMHTDSPMADELGYLVPPAEPYPKVTLKPAIDIRLLDPACGTMHFGLVAFDLLAGMYREEIEHAGREGWPEKPSVENESEIPAAILANNLHGIDIDLRAVQLSALTLYLRAKSHNPKAELKESRLACGDIHMRGDDLLGEFVEQMELSPIYRNVLSALQRQLKDAEQIGALLRLDEEIHAIMKAERKRHEREDRQFDLFNQPSADTPDEGASLQEYWDILEVQIGQALDEFSRQQAEKGKGQSFFAAETTKGLRLLEIMRQKYDVVFTNPPYMTARNMNPVLKSYLQKGYPAAKTDLYAAFIQRCAEWLVDGGRMGMIAQQSFMFISSYEKLRGFLRERIAIETMPHVGPRAFDEVSGEKVNTTLLVFRRETDETIRNDSVGTYFRLVKEPDADAKRLRFEQALENIREDNDDSVAVRYRQGDFDAISGEPWVYWIKTRLRNLFLEYPKLVEIAPPKHGMSTGNNNRFLRFWWEAGKIKINRDCIDRNQLNLSSKDWFPYMKGGPFCRWYGNQEFIVNYH